MIWSKVLSGLAIHLHLCAAIPAQEIAQYLRSHLSPDSGVYLPDDKAWATATQQRWNQWHAPSYIVAVKPKLKEDVQKVIQYSSQNNLSFLTTGAGHGYSGSLNSLHGGIQLDMGNFHGISIDGTKNLMTIGGSVRFSELSAALYSAGKAIAVGACSCVGMAGATLGGGIGFYSGLYGAISDSLVSVEMVTGAGELVSASQTKNQNLFWGMKGAGFNFGTVTSLTYKIYDPINSGKVMSTDMIFPVSLNGSVWKVAQSFFANQPKELSLLFALLYEPSAQGIVVVANAIYAGPQDQGQKLIKPLLDLNPIMVNTSYIPWKDASDTAMFGSVAANCPRTQIYIPFTVNLYQLDINSLIETVNLVSDTVPKKPELQATLVTFSQYSPYGFQQYPSSSSAFPYRKPTVFAQIDGTAVKAEDVQAVDDFGRSVRDHLQKGSGSSRLEVYTHFAHGDEGPSAWYTDNKLGKLRTLKSKYDPKSLFSFYNSLA